MQATPDEPEDTAAPWHASEHAALHSALARLDALVDWERRDRSAGMRVDVEPARDLLARLGDPQRGRPLVHVAGTKGKGSTLVWCEAALRVLGRRTALFTSPHVETVTERLRIDGEPIDGAAFACGLEAALVSRDDAIREGTAAEDASWFDLVIAGSAAAAHASGAEVWLVEVGLGGRLDSTNAFDSTVAGVTSIELEHTAVLGDSRPAIAREKAGIARAGRALVVGLEPDDPAGRAIAEVAREVGAQVRWSPPRGADLDGRNRAVARALLGELEAALGSSGAVAALDALAQAPRLPGRLEWWRTPAGTRVLLDGAHVPESLALVLAELERALAPAEPVVAVFSCARDKRRNELLKVLGQGAETVIGTTLPRHGAGGLDEADAPAPATALARALDRAAESGGAVLVTGSLHLIGPARAHLVSIGAAPCSPSSPTSS